MKITPDTTVHELLAAHPPLLEFLTGYDPAMKKLANPALRATMARIATLERVSMMADVPLNQLVIDIEAEVARLAASTPEAAPAPDAADIENMSAEQRLEVLAQIIRDLHAGAPAAELTTRFRDLLKTVDATEVARMEQQLISEGMPVDEVMRLCDVHVRVFADGLTTADGVRVPAGHPVDSFLRENVAISAAADELDAAISAGEDVHADGGDQRAALIRLAATLAALEPIHVHYLRKENQLFPYLEQHGVSGPSQVMWGIDDEIRRDLAAAKTAAAGSDLGAALEAARLVRDSVKDMVTKEEQVLFPMSLEVLSARQWIDIRQGESAVGYAYLDSVPDWPSEPPTTAFFSLDRVAASVPGDEESNQTSPTAGTVPGADSDGRLPLDTGALTPHQINLLLRTLKVDLNFVDENDEVRFYSEGERIFPRSPGVIGRKVQNCHPPSSVHKVQEIIDAFRAGEKDVADFWIQLHGRFLHIRYLAMREPDGTYKGTVEAVQDITEIKKLEGERRLVDW